MEPGFQVGDIVRYVGFRESIYGQEGPILRMSEITNNITVSFPSRPSYNANPINLRLVRKSPEHKKATESFSWLGGSYEV